jgi:hypothetical protein
MNFEHVADVCLKLIETKFYHIFFHWSWQVRNIFYFILLFIINYRIRTMNFTQGKDDNTGKGIRRGSVIDIKDMSNYQEIVKNILKFNFNFFR